MLEQNFRKYIPSEYNLDASYEFQNPPDEEIQIDISRSGEIERQFSNKSLFEFWAAVDDYFSALKARVFRMRNRNFCGGCFKEKI